MRKHDGSADALTVSTMSYGRRRMRPEDLPIEKKLIQLAEESAELAQAALKLIRATEGDTPMAAVDAREHLLEEIADVKLCADITTTKVEDKKIRAIYTRKCRRWEERLSGG